MSANNGIRNPIPTSNCPLKRFSERRTRVILRDVRTSTKNNPTSNNNENEHDELENSE